MEMQTFEQLATPDQLSLRFTPLGISMEVLFSPEAAAQFIQESISHCELHSNVPDDLRRSFERLRKLYCLGLFEYEAFTVAHDLAYLILEGALQVRFMAEYSDGVPIINKDKKLEKLEVKTFAEIRNAFKKDVRFRKGDWRLRLKSGDTLTFHGTMTQLVVWARKTLLVGQRNKMLDSLFIEIRNDVAHPQYHLDDPYCASLAISDVAEFINKLWGHDTPGGRLYPAPIEREIVVVAWVNNDTPRRRAIMRADQLKDFNEQGDWRCMIVRAVSNDEGLFNFDFRYERTKFPAESLWGPGTLEEASNWIDTNSLENDKVVYLDRLFAIRIYDDKISLPRRPEIAISLGGDKQKGSWLLLKADYPTDAFVHARNIKRENEKSECTELPCGCAIEPILVGVTWVEMKNYLHDTYNTKSLNMGGCDSMPSFWNYDVAQDIEAD